VRLHPTVRSVICESYALISPSEAVFIKMPDVGKEAEKRDGRRPSH
jgi:hypothetical protein